MIRNSEGWGNHSDHTCTADVERKGVQNQLESLIQTLLSQSCWGPSGHRKAEATAILTPRVAQNNAVCPARDVLHPLLEHGSGELVKISKGGSCGWAAPHP